jgi:transcriptional regulator with XRE-family HTH domain
MTSNINEIPAVLGQTLGELRNAVGLKQTDIANRLGIDQSRISRIEKGVVTPTESEVQAYLTAIGTEDAKVYSDFLKLRWEHLERPSFWHPERDALCKAEINLQRLEDFKSQPQVPKLLVNQARK